MWTRAAIGVTVATACGHRDYTLRVIPGANHIHLAAKIGSNAEMATLQRFVPASFTTIREWLATRIRGFGAGERITPSEKASSTPR